VEGTTPGVGVHALVAELGILGLVTHKGARDNHLLATDEDDLLTSEELFGDDGRQATHEVITAVNEDGLFENHDEICNSKEYEIEKQAIFCRTIPATVIWLDQCSLNPIRNGVLVKKDVFHETTSCIDSIASTFLISNSDAYSCVVSRDGPEDTISKRNERSAATIISHEEKHGGRRRSHHRFV